MLNEKLAYIADKSVTTPQNRENGKRFVKLATPRERHIWSRGAGVVHTPPKMSPRQVEKRLLVGIAEGLSFDTSEDDRIVAPPKPRDKPYRGTSKSVRSSVDRHGNAITKTPVKVWRRVGLDLV